MDKKSMGVHTKHQHENKGSQLNNAHNRKALDNDKLKKLQDCLKKY